VHLETDHIADSDHISIIMDETPNYSRNDGFELASSPPYFFDVTRMVAVLKQTMMVCNMSVTSELPDWWQLGEHR
jgi:hypothetical protein